MYKEIMLIDDDMDEHEMFIQHLAAYNENIKVISAYDGPEAFKMLMQASPGCIFLDINMPKMNGLQVLETLKKNEHLKQIPVYIYSTSDGYNSKMPAIKLGAVYYFKKPDTAEEMWNIFKLVLRT